MALSLITDRTAADVAALKALKTKINTSGWSSLTVAEKALWTEGKGAHNAKDLNRVEAAVAYLDGLLKGYGYRVDTTSFITTWTTGSVSSGPSEFNEADATRYLANLAALKAVSSSTTPLPSGTIRATNLIPDGSFETGVGDYTVRAVSTECAHTGTHALKSINCAQWDAWYPHRAAIPGHKYYISQWLYTTVRAGKIFLVSSWFYDGADHWWTGVGVSDNGTLNTWQLMSGVTPPCPQNCTEITVAFGDPETAGSTFYTDDCMIIDLTAAFGAGNEPTKAWCDMNIPYFDGTKAIIQAMSALGVEDLNNMERLLLEVDTFINRMVAGFRICGTFKSGQGVILP